jgi:hypothetical protein
MSTMSRKDNGYQQILSSSWAIRIGCWKSTSQSTWVDMVNGSHAPSIPWNLGLMEPRSLGFKLASKNGEKVSWEQLIKSAGNMGNLMA